VRNLRTSQLNLGDLKVVKTKEDATTTDLDGELVYNNRVWATRQMTK